MNKKCDHIRTLNFISDLTGETVSIAFGYLDDVPTAMMKLDPFFAGDDENRRLIAIPREVLKEALAQGWAEQRANEPNN